MLLATEETTFSRAMKKVGRFQVVGASVMTSGREFRAYSARTIFGPVFKLVVMALLQRRAFANRKHFDLWYAPRRDDPKEQQPDDGK